MGRKADGHGRVNRRHDSFVYRPSGRVKLGRLGAPAIGARSFTVGPRKAVLVAKVSTKLVGGMARIRSKARTPRMAIMAVVLGVACLALATTVAIVMLAFSPTTATWNSAPQPTPDTAPIVDGSAMSPSPTSTGFEASAALLIPGQNASCSSAGPIPTN